MKKALLLLISAWALLVLPSRASMFLANEWTVDLTNPADAKAKVEWSKPEEIGVTSGGLGWDGDANASRDGWIQTQPTAVGISWRAAAAVGVIVEISPLPVPFTLSNGQTSSHWAGTAYARYSPDGSHWSTWQVLGRDSAKADVRAFKGDLQVPNRERKTYLELLSKYSTLDVPWSGDEEAAAQWILKQNPDFFKHNLPFIGYVQILFEAPFGGKDRIRNLKVRWSCGISGLVQTPKDPKILTDREREGPWRFKAP